ncbi:MAG: hypothetical protein P9F75_17760 [Candidatus Contendobacter sp.]|nr:hypothetical protein [Candidatus Contendobacter sp.]
MGLTVRAEQVTPHPQSSEPVTVTAPLAWAEFPPVEVEPLDGRRLTHCPATPLSQAAELLKWSGNRWSIEVFSGISKTGCRVETLRLGTVERLEPALALYRASLGGFST